MAEDQQTVIAKGEIALCDIIDEKKRRTGEQIDVTIVDVRLNGAVPQSYRVYCKTERGTDKYIWVPAEFIHSKPIPTDDGIPEELRAELEQA